MLSIVKEESTIVDSIPDQPRNCFSQKDINADLELILLNEIKVCKENRDRKILLEKRGSIFDTQNANFIHIRKNSESCIYNKPVNSTNYARFFNRRNCDETKMCAKSPDPKLSLSQILDTGNSFDKILKAIKVKNNSNTSCNYSRETSDTLVVQRSDFVINCCRNSHISNCHKDDLSLNKLPRIEQEKCELRQSTKEKIQMNKENIANIVNSVFKRKNYKIRLNSDTLKEKFSLLDSKKSKNRSISPSKRSILKKNLFMNVYLNP